MTSSLANSLEHLSKHHQRALLWFHERAGTIQPWPQPLPDGTLLATKAKGIYKPQWSEYALSVRQTLSKSYPDREPVWRPDGTWRYEYFQEAVDPADRDRQFTNLGLIACQRDGVPVGVMRQARLKPDVKYAVLGVALVVDWSQGYFTLEGFAPDGNLHFAGAREEVQAVRQDLLASADMTAFDPSNLIDGRRRTLAEIVRRQGQPEFRAKLLVAYNGRCAVSGCDVADALEAVHIVPYRGPQTNHISNGLLLRADLHTLFDLGLICIDETTMCVLITPSLEGTYYQQFAGSPVRLPADPAWCPAVEGIRLQRQWAGAGAAPAM